MEDLSMEVPLMRITRSLRNRDIRSPVSMGINTWGIQSEEELAKYPHLSNDKVGAAVMKM